MPRATITAILTLFWASISAQIIVTSSLNQTFSGSPGEIKFIDISLQNTNPESSKIKFSLSDYRNSCSEGYIYEEAGSVVNSISSRISLEDNELILLGKEKATVRIKIEIPSEAEQAHGHICLFVTNEPVMGKIEEGEVVLNIGMSTRFAVNLLFNNKAIELSKPNLQLQNIFYNQGRNMLETEYVNIGTASDRFSCKTEVVDTSGAVIQTINTRKQVIQPDQCRIVDVPLNFDPTDQLYTFIIVARTEISSDLFGIAHDMKLQ